MSAVTCPGCGSGRNPNRLACRDCWYRLPPPLRHRGALLTRESRPLSPEAREQVIADVTAWYAANASPQQVPP